MSRFLVLTDLAALVQKLSLQERELGRRLAGLEESVQKFHSKELPAYENWLRLELGPRISVYEEVLDQIREKRILAWRIEQLVELQGLHPREALYLATLSREESDEVLDEEVEEERAGGEREDADTAKPRAYDRDELDARRQAKRETKRAARKEAKKGAKRELEDQPPKPGEKPSPLELARRRGVSIYRKLAFRLHPDSVDASMPVERARRLWLEVQAAYDSLDWDRLASVEAWLETEDGPRAAVRERSLTERYDRIRTLNRSAGKLERKLAELKLQPAWEFAALRGAELKKLRKRAAQQLEHQFRDAARALEALEDFLESLGPARPPRASKSPRSKR